MKIKTAEGSEYKLEILGKNKWLLTLVKTEMETKQAKVGSEFVGDELLISDMGVVLRKNGIPVWSLGPLLVHVE